MMILVILVIASCMLPGSAYSPEFSEGCFSLPGTEADEFTGGGHLWPDSGSAAVLSGLRIAAADPDDCSDPGYWGDGGSQYISPIL